MKKIFKYQIDRPDNLMHVFPIEMHAGAMVVSAKLQNNKICIWALVDTDCEMVKRTILVAGTSQQIPLQYTKGYFIDSVLQDDFVWHIFDLGENFELLG
jgi:hypothetical protein